MTELNDAAKTTLHDAGISQAVWARANHMPDGRWRGDACGCPDDRCIGHHHDRPDDCGCLPELIRQYRAGEGTFAGPSVAVYRAQDTEGESHD